MSGFTKFFFKLTNFIFFRKNLKIVVINKKLIDLLKIRKIDYLVLDDAVDTRDFKINKKNHFKKYLFLQWKFCARKRCRNYKETC